MNSFFKNYPPTITYMFLAVYAMLTLSHLTAINFSLALDVALFLVTLLIIALIVSTISILTKSTFHVMLLFKNHSLHPSPTPVIPLPIPDSHPTLTFLLPLLPLLPLPLPHSHHLHPHHFHPLHLSLLHPPSLNAI